MGTHDKPADSSSQPAGLRVLMACDTFSPDVNGAARFTERLCAGLEEKGEIVQIVAPAPSKRGAGTRTEYVEGAHLTVHRLPSHKLWGHEWLRFVMPWVASHHARKIITKFQPDAIHIQSHFLIGRAFSAVAAKRGITIIATNHVMPENLLDLKRMPGPIRRATVRTLWWDAQGVLSKAKRVTTPTRKAADFLERNTKIADVLPISCGLDATLYTPNFKKREQNRLVYVGRLNNEKRLDIALRAMNECPPELDIRFDIVGGGDQMDSLQELAKQLGISDRVNFLGRTSDAKLRETLSAGSIFVMPSTAELQSIATLEAMASGLPVVAADAMALPHLIEEGKNGYLFEPDNYHDLAKKITSILNLSDEDYHQMQKESLRIVESHDIGKTIESFENLYRI